MSRPSPTEAPLRWRTPVAAIWAATALCVLLILLNYIGAPVDKFDECIPLVDAAMVQDGLAPHTGFWSGYPPLQYYAVAAMFAVIGRTVLALRFLQSASFLLLLVLSVRFFRAEMRTSRLGPPLFTFALAICVGNTLQVASWLAYATALCVLLAYCESQRKGNGPIASLLGVGFLAAAAVLLRLNFGCYVIVVILADLVLHARERLAARLAAFLGPIALVVGGYLLSYGKDYEVVLQQFNALRLVMLHYRFIELPPAFWPYAVIALPPAWFLFRPVKRISVRLVPLAIALALCACAYTFRGSAAVLPNLFVLEAAAVLVLHRYYARLQRFELLILLLFCLLLHYALSRVDTPHYVVLFPVFGLLLPYVTDGGPALKWFAAGAVFLIRFQTIPPDLSGAGFAMQLLQQGNLVQRKTDAEHVFAAGDEGRAWANLYPVRDEIEAVAYVRERTGKGDFVFVGVDDHAVALASDLRACWLLERKVGVKKHQFEPGMTTEAATQREMIADLERNAVRWVILAPEPVIRDQGNVFLHRTKVHLLDDFLRDHYREVARFGPYVVRVRE